MAEINDDLLEDIQTVGQLKAALEQFPDDLSVECDDYESVMINTMYSAFGDDKEIQYLDITGCEPGMHRVIES